MTKTSIIINPPTASFPGVPPLENGDRLSREEFERRYEAMPQLKKAELIEGVVHVPSPVRQTQQGGPQFHFIGLLASYCSRTPGVNGRDNCAVRLDLDNELQPDGLLFLDPPPGGPSHLDKDGYIAKAPELVLEIASSSASIDLGAKFHVYRRNGVKEYVVWRVLDQAVDWFILRKSQYERLPLSPEGVYQSENFPGLWVDPAALIVGDPAGAYRVLQKGLASPEHAAFVESLKSR